MSVIALPQAASRLATRRVRVQRRSSDDLGDGGDAARAGGKGSGVVAGGVLNGAGVVAGGGVGVGNHNGLALADGRWPAWRNWRVVRAPNPRYWRRQG